MGKEWDPGYHVGSDSRLNAFTNLVPSDPLEPSKPEEVSHSSLLQVSVPSPC